jgi:hypothetical protein
LVLAVLVALNLSLYRTFYRNGGARFAVGAFGLHMLYFAYSSITFASLSIWYTVTRIFREQGRQQSSVDW